MSLQFQSLRPWFLQQLRSSYKLTPRASPATGSSWRWVSAAVKSEGGDHCMSLSLGLLYQPRQGCGYGLPHRCQGPAPLKASIRETDNLLLSVGPKFLCFCSENRVTVSVGHRGLSKGSYFKVKVIHSFNKSLLRGYTMSGTGDIAVQKSDEVPVPMSLPSSGRNER